jgi:hypothetical protein
VLRRLLLLAPLLALLVAPGIAPAQDAPERHRVGLFVTGLHALDVGRGTFGATFWLWAVGPDSDRVLHTADFVNAEQTTLRLESTVPAGPGRSWSQQRVTGTFREHWDLRRYPFDRHDLQILIEEGIEEERRFVYEADTANSGFSLREDAIEGWRLRGMRVETLTTAYPTSFGDPEATQPRSQYSAIRAVLDLERTDWTGFAKLTAALYAAFLLCSIGCLVPVNNVSFSPRITFMVASLFAIVLNMRAASAALGAEHGLTLIDGLHVAGLVYVVTIAGVTIAVRRRQEQVDAGQGDAAALARFDHRLCAAAALLFLAANAALLLAAAL